MQIKGFNIVLIILMGLMVVLVCGCVTPNNQTTNQTSNLTATNSTNNHVNALPQALKMPLE
jgi:hypothetical protein